MSLSRSKFKSLALLAAERADQKKAEEILLLDLHRSQLAVSDYVLILSANSQPHIQALTEIIEQTMEEKGLRPVHREGKRSDHWLVLDYGGLLIHIFNQQVRQFYSIERLWEDAKTIPWSPDKSSRKKKR